jgi:acyl-CoA synthetase (AMP-forming)/AMP-acid ligase II
MKDMTFTGGENVNSIEVEDAIATHPAVQEVAVIGVPSDAWGRPSMPSSYSKRT